MRTISRALQTHIAQESTTLATYWKITRVDSTVMGFTNHDRDLTIGAVTYLAASGYTGSDVQLADALNVDNLELAGIIDSAGITETDIRSGIYDGASVEIGYVNWASPSDGTIPLINGVIGEITKRDSLFVAELRSLQQLLQQNIVEVTSPTCRAQLGDTRCAVRISPPEWQASTAYTVRADAEAGSGSVVSPSVDNKRQFVCTTAGTSGGTEASWNTTIDGTTNDNTVVWTTIQALTREITVTSVTDNATFYDSALDEADNYWNNGSITWVTGDNAGTSIDVKIFTNSGGKLNYISQQSALYRLEIPH